MSGRPPEEKLISQEGGVLEAADAMSGLKGLTLGELERLREVLESHVEGGAAPLDSFGLLAAVYQECQLRKAQEEPAGEE